MIDDPAVLSDDQAFIAFIAACERSIAQLHEPLARRDAVAGHTHDLARHWRMPDENFRRLQPGAPYSSYQLYLNRHATLSVILDLFAPGQVAPVHNHCCWGVFACLEGQELERHYQVPADLSAPPVQTGVVLNEPGTVSVASPDRNAFHQVECVGNAPAISLHIYGADLKALERDRWDQSIKRYVRFTSGSDPRRRQARHYLTAST